MPYLVNLYQKPDEENPSDGMVIGDLCRSLNEAMEEAAFNHLLNKDALTFVGTLNDPSSTRLIESYIREVSIAMANLKLDLETPADSPKEILQQWHDWKNKTNMLSERQEWGTY